MRSGRCALGAALCICPRASRASVGCHPHLYNLHFLQGTVYDVVTVSGVIASYRLCEDWEQLPAGYTHPDVAAVGVDSRGRVYLLCRGDHPVLVYERDGRFVRSWGERLFTRAHGLLVADDDTIWCTDDGSHSVRRFSRDGELLGALDAKGSPSDTGYDGSNLVSVLRGAGPFNRPTNLAIAPSGELYVSDGYGNARVHRFSPDGQLLQSWGEPGTAPGQFMLPHGIAVHPDSRVFVCDRENERIQIFSPDGQYLDEWTSVQRPTDLVFAGPSRVIVAELCWAAGMRSYRRGIIERDLPGRVTILDEDGRVHARVGQSTVEQSCTGRPDPCSPGNFLAPHSLALDPNGDLYVAEVAWTIHTSAGLGRPDCHTIQKFTRAQQSGPPA